MKNITPVSRRQFIQRVVGGLTAITASFFILPSSLTYQRIWKFILSRPPEQVISGSDFADFLVRELPRYDELILKDIKPTDGWLATLPTGPWREGVYEPIWRGNPGPQFPSHNENGLPHPLYLPRG